MQRLTVVKIGGHVVDEAAALKEFLVAFAALDGKKILVHGGGKAGSRLCRTLGLTPVMVDGRRVTDAATLEVLTGVYGGTLNKSMVSLLQGFGLNAIGLTGADGRAVEAKRRADPTRDWGYVGDVTAINVSFLDMLLAADLTPVMAPLTLGDGTLLNTNADTLASAIAVAFKERYDVALYYCFEHAGVLLDVADPSSVLPHLDRAAFEDLCQAGKITAGMLPKLTNAFAARASGLKAVGICKAGSMAHFARGATQEGTWLQ